MVFKNCLIMPIILLVSFSIFNCTKSPVETEDDYNFTNLTGDYLGQTPPGSIPVVFAPGTTSTPGIRGTGFIP